MEIRVTIPDAYVETFEAVCLQAWDDARPRCGEALAWLEVNGYIRCSRSKSRSKKDPLGIPVRLTAKGIEESKARGLYNATFAEEYAW